MSGNGDPRPMRVGLTALARMSLEMSEAAASLVEVNTQLQFALRSLPTPYHQFINGPLEELSLLQKRLEAYAGKAVAYPEELSPSARGQATAEILTLDNTEKTDA